MDAPMTATGRRGLRSEHTRAIKIVKSCTINRSQEELYRFWRQLENLPDFSRHLISVRQTSATESHWIVKSPAGTTSEWDAMIIHEKPYEVIAWESLPGSEIDNAGSVRFAPAPGGQGTELTVKLEYIPPVGRLGALVAKIYGEEPNIQVEDDLLRFKALMEAGEIPSIEGQPHGPTLREHKKRRVE